MDAIVDNRHIIYPVIQGDKGDVLHEHWRSAHKADEEESTAPSLPGGYM